MLIIDFKKNAIYYAGVLMDNGVNITSLLGYKLKKTQHALRLHMDEALRVVELTTPQYSVLAQIELRPGISSAALARASFITAQTMHGIVSNLEKRGLIERRNDAKHGRILRTILTKSGVKLLKQAHKVIKQIEMNMTLSMSGYSIRILEELLLECFNNLHESKAG